MFVSNAAANGQAQACSLGPRGVERFKDRVALVAGHSGASVKYIDDMVVSLRQGAHHDRLSRGRHFNGIVQEVVENLCNTIGIKGSRDGFKHIAQQSHLVLYSDGSDALGAFGYQLCKVRFGKARRTWPRVAQQIFYKARQTVGFVHDSLRGAVESFVGGVDALFEQLGIAFDRRNGRSDFVRQDCGELAERCKALSAFHFYAHTCCFSAGKNGLDRQSKEYQCCQDGKKKLQACGIDALEAIAVLNGQTKTQVFGPCDHFQVFVWCWGDSLFVL